MTELNALYACDPEVIGVVVEGTWTEWGQWGKCTTTCFLDEDVPFRRRSRFCSGPDGQEVMGCEGKGSESEKCKIPYCPKADGEWLEWAPWSKCTKSCDKGSRMRSRECPEGKRCPTSYGGFFEDGACNTHKCGEEPSLFLTEWYAWQHCQGKCGEGKMKRMRMCKFGNDPSNDCDLEGVGEYVEPGYAYEIKKCELKCTKPQPWSSRPGATTPVSTTTTEVATTATANTTAPTAAEWADWGLWASCSASCDGGTKQRERECRGDGCVGNETDTTWCSTDPCEEPDPPTGIFTKNHDWNSLLCAYGSLSVGDFNKDGRTDLICVYPDGYIHIYHASSSGTYGDIQWQGKTEFCKFSEASDEDYARGTKIHVADINGDGYDDLVCFNMATGKLEALINDAGDFKPKPDWEGARESCNVRAGAVFQLSDINGDGKSDLVCGDSKHPVKDIFFSEL